MVEGVELVGGVDSVEVLIDGGSHIMSSYTKSFQLYNCKANVIVALHFCAFESGKGFCEPGQSCGK